MPDRTHVARFLARELTTPERSLLLQMLSAVPASMAMSAHDKIRELRELLCGDHAGRYLDKEG